MRAPKFGRRRLRILLDDQRRISGLRLHGDGAAEGHFLFHGPAGAQRRRDGRAIVRAASRSAALEVHRPRPWVQAELGLSAQQQQQFDAIWAQTQKKRDTVFEQRRALADERDQQLLALLSTEQRASYDKILKDYHDKVDESNRDFDKSIAAANQRSRELLDDGQKKTWDNMTSERMIGRRGSMRSTTQGSTRISSTRPAGGWDRNRN